MRATFDSYDAIPVELRRFRESIPLTFAAAGLTGSQEIVSVLECWSDSDDSTSPVCGYVLTHAFLIQVVVSDGEPVGEAWKLADIASVRLKKFVAENEFGRVHTVGFDTLELRLSSSPEAVTIPAFDGSSSRDRAEFLGALWNAWTDG